MEILTEKEFIEFFIKLNQERTEVCYYLGKMTADFQNNACKIWGKRLNQIDYDIEKFEEILLHKFQEELFADYIEKVGEKIILFQKPRGVNEGRGLYYVIGKAER